MDSPTVATVISWEQYQQAKAVVQAYEARGGSVPSGAAQLADLQARLSQQGLVQRIEAIERHLGLR